MYTKELQELSERLDAANLQAKSVVTGFDGFVDEMISVVDERQSVSSWTAVQDITTFAALLASAAGRSSLREIVVHRADPGGCAINLGDGLAQLGVPVDCFATLGDPQHAAFREVTSAFRSTHSWGAEPGRTLAFEFTDGKLMFSAVQQLGSFNVQYVREQLAKQHFVAACRDASVICLTDWTLYPNMTSVWQLLQNEVFSQLQHRPRFFLDLVDPTARSPKDIREMANQLKGFERFGQTVLGLNAREAGILSRVMDLPPLDETLPHGYLDAARRLREALGISEVLIHLHREVAAATASSGEIVYGPYCEKPLKSTGAGDRFNAGYCVGLLLEAPLRQRLLFATAVSGLFVRLGRSPLLDELKDFIKSWGTSPAA